MPPFLVVIGGAKGVLANPAFSDAVGNTPCPVCEDGGSGADALEP